MASRAEEKARRKQERLEREQQAQHSTQRKRLIGVAAAAILVAAAVAAIVIVVISSSSDVSVPGQKIAELKQAAAAANCVVEVKKDEGNEHLQPNDPAPKYKSNPPTSGPHNPVPLEDGIYDTIEPDEAMGAVHSLEHGRVVIQYRDITDEQKQQLKNLVEQDPDKTLLIPNTTRMPYQVAATAWNDLLGCKTMNDKSFDAIRAFQKEHRGRGPEALP